MSAETTNPTKLTVKQKKFCDEYLITGNATRSAIAAGHPKRSAYSIGWENLRKPEIKAYINARLSKQSLSKEETLKSISDIARGNINQYFVTRTVVTRQKIKISLSEFIERMKERLETDVYIHDIALAQGLLGSGEVLDNHIIAHDSFVLRQKYELVKLEVELAQRPDATRIIDGPDDLSEVADLDLVALIKDKEAGRIKSFTMTENGPKVEMYPADAALTNLAKIHGLFKLDNEQSKPDPININNLSDDDLILLMKMKKKV